jgi:peptide/nickel transport system permease protein
MPAQLPKQFVDAAKYVGSRLIFAILLLFAVTLTIYTAGNLASDANIRNMAARVGSTPEQIAESLHLNSPGYFEWVFGGAKNEGIIRGDYGDSFEFRRASIELFQERLPASLELFGLAPTISLVVGIPLGILMALLRRWRAVDSVARLIGLLGVAMPVFLVGLVGVLIFAVSAHILPTGGRCDSTSTVGCASYFQHLILPVASLSGFWIASVALYLRQAILSEIKKEPEDKAQFGHLVAGTLLSLLQAVPVLMAGIIGSQILVELVFSWPGLGPLLFRAVMSQDYANLTAIITITACWVVLAYLALNGLYAALALILHQPIRGFGVTGLPYLLLGMPMPSPESRAAAESHVEPESSTRPLRQTVGRLFSGPAVIATLTLILLALFADFLAPFDPSQINSRSVYAPPQTLHLIDEQGNWGLYVNGYTSKVDSATLRREFVVDPTTKIPVKFFAHGWSYRLFGLIETDVHLLGTETPDQVFYLLGADRLGRDQFARVLIGGRNTLVLGFLAASLSLIIGVVLGVVAGLAGGLLGEILNLPVGGLLTALNIIPPIFLLLFAAATFSQYTLWGLAIFLGLVIWPPIVPVVRARTRALVSQWLTPKPSPDLPAVSDPTGSDPERGTNPDGEARSARKQFLKALLVVPYGLAIGMAAAIMLESSLSFVGLGIRPPSMTWGTLFSDLTNLASLGRYSYLLTVPGLLIVLTLLCLYVVAARSHDALGA